MKKQFFISSLILLLLLSCTGREASTAHDKGDTISLKHAEHLTMVRYNGLTVVNLSDPWNKGKTLHTYILVPEKSNMPENPPQGTIVRTPLKRAVVTTSVHCGLIMSFGKGNNIKGVCDTQYINLPWIKQQCKNGNIADCGNAITPSLEKIIEINADAILISPFQNNGGYGRIEEWGNPIIETADYMETSALGRAEWMKFYGMLFGAENTADSIFKEVEREYNSLKEKAGKSKNHKSVLFDKMNGSVWYVPGGNSTTGKLIADSYTKYPFSYKENSGGIPLPFETVLEKAGQSDVWMFRYNSINKATLKSLRQEHTGYSQFKAFKNKEVYGCNTYYNTFYEDTPFHPELLLRDFILILHPESGLSGKPRYFEKLK